MANVLTILRIICGLLILICPAFSGRFYLFYLLGGFTDAIDGTVARALGKESDFGAKLDTVADFVFVSAVIIKLAMSVFVPVWLMIWIGMIVIIKLSNVIIGAIKYHNFVTVHSIMNKICGVVVFVTPLFIGLDCLGQTKTVAVIFVCIIATIAAMHESYIIYSGKTTQ